jgi:hypothetical protein
MWQLLSLPSEGSSASEVQDVAQLGQPTAGERMTNDSFPPILNRKMNGRYGA